MVSLFGLEFTLKYKAKRGRDTHSRRAAFRELTRHLEGLEVAAPPLRVTTAPGWQRLSAEVAAEAARHSALDRAEDELDAIMCAYVALHYWTHGTAHCRVVGDALNGYIVTPVTIEFAEALDRLA